MKFPRNYQAKQTGYVLLTTIILVLVMTLLALAGVSLNSTQTRVATNSRDYQIAFETAEAALRQVNGNLIAGLTDSKCIPSGATVVAGIINYTCQGPGIDTTPLWQTNGAPWSSSLQTGATYQGDSFQPAQYIVEQLVPKVAPGYGGGSSVGGTVYIFPYRVTVLATGAINNGAAGTTQVMLQNMLLLPEQ